MTQQALARPIEITSALKDLQINHTGGVDTIALDMGVSPAIPALVDHINDKVSAADAALSCYLSTDYKVVFARSSGTIDGISFNDIGLGKILGFRENILSSQASHTATDTPKFLWLPSLHSYDVDRMWSDYQFSGAESTTGIPSGISLSSGTRKRTIKWAANPEAIIAEDGCTVSFSWSGTEYPELERCLEKFVRESRTSSPASSTAEGISTKGFYLIYDLDVYTGSTPTVALPSTMDGGGYKRKLASSPDRYIWCHMASGLPTPKPSISNFDSYYDVELPLTASPDAVPTWNIT